MSRLTDLIARAKAKDPALGDELDREFKALASRRAFGLNFERHQPESVELPGRGVRRGDKVHMLPPRGSTSKGDQRLWRVLGLTGAGKARVAHLSLIDAAEPETSEVPVVDLVVVAEFRDYIYPGLVSTGKVTQGGDKPFHTVINGENFHALEALTYTHRGKIDAIYIDPPYNTGARDWKYNNDYVEGDDLYRHSKWLAMMERRLLVSKELLNPTSSVLIVTIDEKEFLRLGLLLEQIFDAARIQMVTVTVNPRAGVARPDAFTRVEEFAFFLQFGESQVGTAALSGEASQTVNSSPIWFSLMRTGSNSARSDRPNLFYPIWVEEDGGVFSVGDSVPLGMNRELVPAPREGLTSVWPIRPDGSENTWQLGPESVRKALIEGNARVNARSGKFTVNYLRTAEKKRIALGEIEVLGKDDAGALLLRHREGAIRQTRPKLCGQIRRMMQAFTAPRYCAPLFLIGSSHFQNLCMLCKTVFDFSLGRSQTP